MRVLVAGREGQLARALVARLVFEGHQVAALEPPELDLTDRASILAAMAAAEPDLVVNAAAYTAVDRAEDQPELARAVNATGADWVAHSETTTTHHDAPLLHKVMPVWSAPE